MALTVTADAPLQFGLTRPISGEALNPPMKIVTGTVAFGATYPAFGEVLLPATLGLKTIVVFNAQTFNGYQFQYDYTNSKLQIWESPDFEVVDGAISSGISAVHFLAIGT